APLDEMLTKTGVPREPMVDQGLRFIRRTRQNGHDYFIANRNEHAIDGWVPLAAAPIESAVILDSRFEDHAGAAALRRDRKIYLQLEPGESCIVRTFSDPNMISGAKGWTYSEPTGNAREISGKWQVHFIEGGPKLPAEFQTEKLASW